MGGFVVGSTSLPARHMSKRHVTQVEEGLVGVPGRRVGSGQVSFDGYVLLSVVSSTSSPRGIIFIRLSLTLFSLCSLVADRAWCSLLLRLMISL